MDALFCHADPAIPLISSGGRQWSQADFLREMEAAASVVAAKAGELDGENFILLNERHPVRLYSFLLALIRAGYRVLVPNRDFFAGSGAPISFASQIVTPGNDSLRVDPNTHFLATDIPSGNVIVFSSGSTGTPKGVVHDFDHFLVNARSVLKTIRLKGHVNLTWLSPYLVSAISHFLCHWMSDSHLIYDDFENLSRLPETAALHPGLGVMGSPIHITNAVHVLPEGCRPGVFFSSGDAISRHAVASLLAKFPATTFYVVYGLAEVAGRFFINPVDAGTDYQGDLGAAIEGYRPTVDGGRMLVESEHLFHGYVVNGEFRPSAEVHDSGDVVSVRDGRTYMVGRSNDEVKVLGNKLNLKFVETRTKEALGTDDLVIVVSANEKLGNLLALVLLRPEHSRLEIMTRLRAGLDRHELPHLYYAINEFPFTQTMKIDRKRIAANLNGLKQLL